MAQARSERDPGTEPDDEDGAWSWVKEQRHVCQQALGEVVGRIAGVGLAVDAKKAVMALDHRHRRRRTLPMIEETFAPERPLHASFPVTVGIEVGAAREQLGVPGWKGQDERDERRRDRK